MVEAMDIDENGVSGHATPAESVTESSFNRDQTPESTEVLSALLIPCVSALLMGRRDRCMYVSLLASWSRC